MNDSTRATRAATALDADVAFAAFITALQNWRSAATAHAATATGPTRRGTLREDAHLFRAIVAGVRTVLADAAAIETQMPAPAAADLAREDAAQVERALS